MTGLQGWQPPPCVSQAITLRLVAVGVEVRHPTSDSRAVSTTEGIVREDLASLAQELLERLATIDRKD